VRGQRLSGRVGAGLDPCGALQTTVDLPAGGRADVVFFLGEAANAEQARTLILRYRARDVDAVLRSIGEHWNQMLGTVQVRTPDRAMDIVLNRWLLYQTLACRVWARSAFYQAGGAYGFRDRYRTLALMVAARAGARAPAARRGRQFGEATSSAGGTHPAGAASARISATGSGCLRRRPLPRRHGDGACSTRSFRSSTAPAWPPGSSSRTSSLASRRSGARSSSTARARSTTA
jgi:hypothetical protein